MFTWTVNIFYLLVDFPGATWRGINNLPSFMRNWWYSHY